MNLSFPIYAQSFPNIWVITPEQGYNDCLSLGMFWEVHVWEVHILCYLAVSEFRSVMKCLPQNVDPNNLQTIVYRSRWKPITRKNTLFPISLNRASWWFHDGFMFILGMSPVSIFQPLETCWFSAFTSWIQFIQRLGKLQREHSLLKPKTSGKSLSQEIASEKSGLMSCEKRYEIYQSLYLYPEHTCPEHSFVIFTWSGQMLVPLHPLGLFERFLAWPAHLCHGCKELGNYLWLSG